MMLKDPRIARLITLIRACLHPPQGARRIGLALTLGVVCHIVFAAGVLAMIVTRFFGTPLARLATTTVAEGLLRLSLRGTNNPAMSIKPGELRRAIQGTGLAPGPVTRPGPRGMNRRLDLTSDPLPLTAILYMGIARKPALSSGNTAC